MSSLQISRPQAFDVWLQLACLSKHTTHFNSNMKNKCAADSYFENKTIYN